MKKQPELDQAVDYVERDQQLANLFRSFEAGLKASAPKTRTDLVETVFDRCHQTDDLDWPAHAQLAIVLGDIRSRDGLLRKLHDEPEARSTILSHLCKELQRAEDSYLAPFATVIAGIAWLDGDATLANEMVDRALAADSAYSLAQLLDIALRHNVPPHIWSQSLAAVSYESCIAGAA